ncbi:MAG: hypothetical protein AAFQ51_07710 [Pseudomonadota bacterium]
MTFDDDDLIAFHRGTLANERAEALAARLETDTALVARLMALDPAKPMVADAFARITPPPVDLPMSSLGRPMLAAASGALVASAAALILWVATLPSGPAWHRQVAEYQVLYTAQTVSMIPPSAEALIDQFGALRATLSVGFGSEALADVKGLELLRAQILGFEGAPLGQIVFADPLGRPVALCLMRGGGQDPVTEAELAGLNTVAWSSGTHDFLLVGPVPRDDLLTWANALRTRI